MPQLSALASSGEGGEVTGSGGFGGKGLRVFWIQEDVCAQGLAPKGWGLGMLVPGLRAFSLRVVE